MNHLIERLCRHHGNFRQLLDVVEVELKVLENGGQPDYELLRNVMLYLSRYAVPFHDPCEDAIGERLAQRLPGITSVLDSLRAQQHAIAENGSDFLLELDALEAGAMILRRQVGVPGRTFVDALRRHMAMEEETLFPEAIRLFEARDWQAITQAASRRPSRADGHYRMLQQAIVREVGCDCAELAA
jgi:hemerythrin-like domain-containing protein